MHTRCTIVPSCSALCHYHCHRHVVCATTLLYRLLYAYRLLSWLLYQLCSARAWIMDSQASAVECSAGQPQASKRSGSCGECAEVCCGGVQCRGGAGGGAERMQIRCSCDVRGGAEASGRVRREGAEGGAQREDAEWRRGVEQRRGAGRHLRAGGGSGPHHVIRLV